MRIQIRRQLSTFIRMAVFATLFVGPVGAFAYANTGDKGPALSGAGFVLYVSLQRERG